MGFLFVKNCPIAIQKQNIDYLWMTFENLASFFRVEKSLKLKIKSVEKFNYKRQYLIFSSVLSCQFITLSLFFRSQRKQSEFKILSTKTCRSVNPTLRESRNNATSIELLRCCNSLLSGKTRLNNFFKVSIDTFKLVKEYLIENALSFFPCHRIVIQQ